ncbi:MAG TPA: DUF4279 domain-containing protein [Candidatus Binatus sp.]|jgi:hypothetical protein|nr:DUF4279 domain-containing protein [Candidatus Binatus sp.]
MLWPERFEERLHIFAHGERFDVDAFLANSSLRPDFVWRREAPATSGVEFFLGDGRAIKLRDQEDIAIAYLKAHRDELRAIAEFRGVDTFILGLVYIAELVGSVTGVSLHWPRDLMLPALDIGITPAHYITYDRPAQAKAEPYAYFYIAGAFDPDEISRRVGVAPSRTARAGDAIGSTRVKRQSSLWALHSRLQPSGRVDLHVSDVLDQLDTNRLAFEELSREVGGIIEIVGFSSDYAPAVSLEREIVGRMTQYSLRLDMTANR